MTRQKVRLKIHTSTYKLHTNENGHVKKAVAILRLKYKKLKNSLTSICRWLDYLKKPAT